MKKQHKPPRLADKLLQWYCQHAAMEDLEGDLEELFYKNLDRMRPGKARLLYWQSVLSLIFSYAVRQRKHKASAHYLSSNRNNFPMLVNYCKVAVRTLARHRFFTIINVAGLAIGMSFSLLLIAMVSYLRHYDSFHLNKDRIYRVISHVRDNDDNADYATTPLPLADKILHDYAQAQQVVRINNSFSANAKLNTQEIPLQGYFVDPSFLEVFTFPLVKGNALTALAKPYTLVITERAAHKMFGEDEPIGKVITMGEFGDFEVTGVMKDYPVGSHFQFEILGSYSSWVQHTEHQNTSVTNNPWHVFDRNYVYLLLPENLQAEDVDKYLASVSDNVYKDSPSLRAAFALQNLNDIVPGPHTRRAIGPEWDNASRIIFAFLTLLILLPACFNYANISIARALKRAKEIGLRKVVGGLNRQIFFQFIMETVIITLCALVLAYGLFLLVKPEFLSMLVAGDTINLEPDAVTILLFIGFAMLVGFVAGVVPAMYFARMNPIQALKQQTSSKGIRRFSFRKVLIVGQFALSLGFIMTVVIALRQYQSSMNYNFGFDQENILDVDLQGVDPILFRSEYSKISSIAQVSMSSAVTGTGGVNIIWLKGDQQADSVEAFYTAIDQHYIPNLKLTLIAGKNFTDDMAANGQYIIVNEEFVRQNNLPGVRDAVGKMVQLKEKEATIIGVVKNFHYADLSQPIKSFFFQYDQSQWQFANLKITSNDMISTFTDMEQAWKPLAGEKKFKAEFLDDEIAEAYANYFTIVKICGFLGLLSISISCLGLLGMVVYTAETRMKEMGVRKVMGASSWQLLVLLSKGYLQLMVIAAFIAVPLTYLFFDKMVLKNNYYRIEIGVPEVLISLGIMISLGAVTVFSQTLRAARTNPVDTLRYE